MRTYASLVLSVIVASGLMSTGTAQTWTEITANLPVAPKVGSGQSIASDGTALYILASPNGVLRSTDNGNTWSAFHTVTGVSYNLSQYGSRSIDAIGNTLWAGVEPGSGALTEGVLPLYRTIAPAAWTPSFAGASPPPVIDAVAYDSSTNTHWAAGRLGGIFKSTDGGSTWAAANGNLPGTSCASIVARNGKVIAAIAGNGMGAFTSTDGGITWSNNGVPLPSIGSLAAIGDNVCVIGSGSTTLTTGIYFSQDFGLTWNLNQVDTAGGVKLLTETCSDATTMFSGGVYLLISPTFTITRIPTVAFSLNGGATWDDIPATGIPNGIGTQPARLCRHGNYLFTISGDNKLYRLDLNTVTLTPTLKIAVHPKIDKKITGGTLTMKVYAGGPGTLSYQWKKDNIDVPGQITDTLSIPNAQASATGNYTCVVTAGGNSVTSNPARGTVVDKVEGRYDPTFDRTNMGGGESGIPFLQSDGSLVVPYFGGVYKLGPDGGRVDIRNLANSFTGGVVDSSGRIVLVGGTNASTWRVRRLLGSAGFPDDNSFPLLSTNATLRGVTELPGHGYLVSGDFSTMGPAGGTQVTVPRLVLVDYNGNLNSTFNTNLAALIGLGVSATPYVSSDGAVWVLANAVLRKVDSAGMQVAGFTNYAPGPSSDFVSSAAVLKSGKLLVTLGTSGARRFKLFNADGSFDSTFNTAGLTLSSTFTACTEQADGKIVLGGNFSSYGSNSCAGYMRISATGVFDSSFYCATGFSTAGSGGIAYDPRGYIYMANGSNNATSGAFQDSATIGDVIGKNFIRVFATAATSDPFASWASGFSFPVGKDGPNDDADGDGLPNLIEFLYGGNPLLGSSPAPGRVFPTTPVADGASINLLAPGAGLDPVKKYQLLSMRVPKNTQGYTVGISATVNLPAFDGSATANEYGTPADDGDFVIKSYYLMPSQSDAPKMFWRGVASQ
ncbi:hypothetical protein HZ994_16580 [Akkermansiaceae bacterium]|nr:hypothetical protein HZ994_16580 [Akkermansiaceae bacterium]